MEIHFLGGAGEVGRSAILLDTGIERFIWDYGVNVQDNSIPLNSNVNVDGVFISHAHMDHGGMVPLLYKKGYRGETYAAPVTFDLMSILHRDGIKIQKKNGEEQYFTHREN